MVALYSAGNAATPAPFYIRLWRGSSQSAAQVKPAFPDTENLHRTLRLYEAGMMKRASGEMTSSRDNLAVFFGPEAAKRVSNLFRMLWWMDTILLSPVRWVQSFWR